MTHRDLQDLVEFNYWARDRMLESVAGLSPEEFTRPMGNSFSSVRDTLAHLYFAEWVWYWRWQGVSPGRAPSAEDFPDLATLKAAWRELETKLREFVGGLDDVRVNDEIEYRQLNGQVFRSPIWQMVQHVVNHGSYHRGQVTTLLRQLGGTPAKTDLIAFYRERKMDA